MMRLIILCTAAVGALLSDTSALNVPAAAHNAVGFAPLSTCAVRATPASSILTATSGTLSLALQGSVRRAESRVAPYASSAMHLRGGQAEDSPLQFPPEWHDAMRNPAPLRAHSASEMVGEGAPDSPLGEGLHKGCDSCGQNFSLSGNLETHELCTSCGNFFEPETPFEPTAVYSLGGDGGLPVENVEQ